jgi:cyanophycinase
MQTRPLLALSCALLLAVPLGAAAQPTPSPRGHLLIVGGGPKTDTVFRRFVDLAGGPGRARIVIFPMASSDSGEADLEARLQRLGAEGHTPLFQQADTEAAVAQIGHPTGIFFDGGDQVRLADILRGTKVEAALHRLYDDGAVISGTSAGAAVMTTPMITGDEKRPGGDRPPKKGSPEEFMTIARDNIVTAVGFGFLPGAIVDQHFIRRRRLNRLISLVLEHPDLIGAGIDEMTALEVDPNGMWRVLGDSAVVIFDARHARIAPPGQTLGATDVSMHVLPSGSTYDPATGKATLPSAAANQ